MIRHSGIPVCLGLLLSACAVGPDYQRPAAPEVDAFESASTDYLTTAAVEAEWWQQLQEPQLNALIRQAIEHNHDLAIARANLRAARALLSEGQLSALPSVTLNGEATRQKTPSGSGTTFDNRSSIYDAGLDAVWELDFFGRVRRGNEALAANYQARLAGQEQVAITVTAEVARTYTELRGAQLRLAVAQRNAEIQQQSLELTQALLDGGRGTRLDVAQARAQLESTQATIPLLETTLRRAIHRLSVLVGQPPGHLSDRLQASAPVPQLPAEVRIGDPGALIRRRPDIQAAERQLAAATARIGVAVADLFPRITLFGSAGYFTTNSNDFGTAASERWSVGPGISWAAFDLGRVRARIRAEEADAEADLATYQKTVLTALEETENALVRYVQARKREQRLNEAATASTDAAAMARLRYRNGRDTFLTVLDAERRQLQAEDQLAQGRAESVLGLIALYKALGGGWAQPPTPNAQG